MDGKPVGELHEGQLIWNRRWGLDDASSEPWPRETLVNGVENSMLYTLPECTYFTHVQTCNVTRVQSATEWTASVHTLHMSKPVMKKVAREKLVVWVRIVVGHKTL